MKHEDWILLATVIVAFVIGYAIVSAVISALKRPGIPRPKYPTADQKQMPPVEEPAPRPPSTDSMPSVEELAQRADAKMEANRRRPE
ncbi:hypothetical protein LLG95_01070 [bacterium]|nr:hypothetical protein [bacterium]